MSVGGVVLVVSAVVPVCPSIVHIPALQREAALPARATIETAFFRGGSYVFSG